jgi:lysophospholipase L1-like esterase
MKNGSTIIRLALAGTLTALAVTAPPLGPALTGAGSTGSVRSTGSIPSAGSVSSAGSVGSAGSGPSSADAWSKSRWTDTWVSMPQLTEPANLPPAPFTQDAAVLVDATVRQTVRASIGGRQLRLRFSNAFGNVALPITKVAIALPAGGQAGVSGIEPDSSRTVTFGGRSSVVIPAGAQMVSDPLAFDLAARSNLSVTIYLAQGQASTNITSHPGSRTTSYLLAGDHVEDPDLPAAASVAHWYFLSGIEVTGRPAASASVMLGDSLTDGRGSVTNANNRWPDQLIDRLQSDPSTAGVAILNQAAGGNRVLNDGLGPNALARLDRDVLAQSGVRSMIVFEGINDIGTAPPSPAAQRQVAADLIAAYDQIILRAHAQEIQVFGATLLPFGGNEGYDDPDGYRESARQVVNRWIRTSHHFDAVIDFDAVTRDPARPRQLQAALDVGDHLHLNPAGYQVLADAVPVRLFR